jgi:leader peptidase (prepilin peptidase)/N-methyltransferase
MSRYALLNAFLHFLFFFMGAGIGSFLNVVIYRLPRGMSLNQPRRSFCPTCKQQIPMWLNIPLVSWIMLRGTCAKCGSAISARYLGVELLTGLLFYAVFWKVGGDWAAFKEWGPVMLCLWIFVSLLVSGSFIDIEHFILPHEITLGGTVIGLISATLVPSLVGEDLPLRGFLLSLASAALGLGGLWLVVELGKLAFGRKKYRFDPAEAWTVTQPNEEEPPVVTLAGEAYGWGDIYSRASDRMIITCATLRANEQTWDNVTAELWMEKLKVCAADGKIEEIALEKVTRLEGSTTEVVIPREAMGFGDVLLLMMIGSFLGWKAVLFTVFAASVVGTLIAGLARVAGRSEWGAKIPFGPYLAAGALGWLFCGREVLTWYMGLMARGQVEAF